MDAEIYLATNGLGDTIQTGKETTVEQKAKAMIFLRHHLHENLKIEYLTVKITSQLTLCGGKIIDEEMLKKIFSTFHASNLLLQQQYRERGFKKHCDLISCLLVAEQNNDLLMKNHQPRLTGSAPLSEANMVAYNQSGGHSHGCGSDRRRGHGRGRGRGQGSGFGRAANAPIKIDVPKEHSVIANESKARLKRGRPIGFKDKNPQKKKGACNQDGQVEVKETLEGSSIRTLDMTVQEEPRVPENEEISINYVMSRKIWNQNEINVDDTFAYNVALEVMENDEDHEPKSVSECKNRNDWPKWKDEIEAELKSLEKRKVLDWTLDGEKDPFRPPDDDEEMLGQEVPYLSAIGTLLFLASHTRPDISFSLNLLARYSSCPTRRHWNGVKQVFCYLQGQEAPTTVHEDNAACIAQIKDGYIKGDRTKHILPKFFFIHDLQKSGDIVVQHIHSSDNLTDLFTKVLPTATFNKLVYDIEMRRLKELK
uniref:Retrovirus-related Pol polyprotein from transposon TNT 1-94 n=1 Tax=Tanacetum cinerariifolium TaxID=118510 RepID=A0A699I5K5_TANCI|nr:hypothetical protein [Tanacetum cinerariifolium]